MKYCIHIYKTGLRLYNCTNHMRLKLRIAIKVGTELFFIKVCLLCSNFLKLLMVYTIMNYFQPNIHIT